MNSCIIESGSPSCDRPLNGLAGAGGCVIRKSCAEGTVLIVTMWVMLVLVGLVLVLARSMRVEGSCSANTAASEQALAIEQGAIQYVLAHIDGLEGRTPLEEDMPSEAVQVGEGAFWIIRPDPEDDQECLYGLVGEASRLSLNSATVEMLLKLPDMTNELAAAIVDWRDGDDEPTAEGAESQYYLLLTDPYECKNAPLETVEELLLVNGSSREILFGEDINRNGVLEENENDADQSDPPDNRDGRLDRGIFDYLTVYSGEPNSSAAGSERVNVNQAQRQALSELFEKSVSQSRLRNILDRTLRERPFQNILDFYLRSGLTSDEFTAIADELTTGNDINLVGLINVNTAPKQVLLCLPDLEESDVSTLLASRSDDQTDRDSIAWVTEALPREKAVAIGSYITARTLQFSADIVSVSGNGRAFRRCRIVADARNSPPRVIYRRDLTYLGWPLSLEIIDQLRSGTPMEQVVQNLGKEFR